MRPAFFLPVVALLVVLGAVATVEVGGRGGGSKPAASASSDATPAVTPAIEAPKVQLKPGANVCQSVLHRPEKGQPQSFPALYTKRATAHGITIVADALVDDRALAVATATLDRMFANNQLATPIADQGAYIIVADRSQGVLDLPEFACLESQVKDGFFTHVCGVADRADYPVATVNELDLLGDKSGPCRGLNILYHETGHLVQGWAMGPSDYFDVKFDYHDALSAGKYKGMYAATNSNEYFAEATQAYFLTVNGTGNQDRAWLKDYDPNLCAGGPGLQRGQLRGRATRLGPDSPSSGLRPPFS